MSENIQEMPNNPMERDRFIPPSFRILGKRGAPRIDGFRKASGAALYARDVILPGMLYARWLTCPYANARIVNMDTSKAEAFPGVRTVLRYDDPEVYGKRIPTLHGGEEDILAGYAYFQGQQIGAVVAADTEDTANEALKLIRVEWDERPFVLDPEEALEPGAPLARPEWRPEGNLLPLFFQPSNVFSFGNVEEGFKEADKIITFEARRRYHGCADAELVSGITKWEGQCAELWLHHQHPYEHKWMMNQWFGIPMSQVKINAPYNGGMFGGWNWIDYGMVPQYISALLSKKTGKPVKWIFDRRDDFHFGSLDAMKSEFKVGFKMDGTITAVKIRSFFENLSFEPGLHWKTPKSPT